MRAAFNEDEELYEVDGDDAVTLDITVEKQLKRAIKEELSAQEDDGRIVISPGYRHMLVPYEGMPYPQGMTGILSRVDRRFILNWINVPKLTKILKQNDNISYLFCQVHGHKTGDFDDEDDKVLHVESGVVEKGRKGRYMTGQTVRVFDCNIVADVLCELGARSHTYEWNRVAAMQQNSEVLQESIGFPIHANGVLARGLEYVALDFYCDKNRRMRVIDMGSGNEAITISSTVQMLHCLAQWGLIEKDYFRNLQLFMNDVSIKALEQGYRALVRRYPFLKTMMHMTTAGNIVPIASNFVDMHKDANIKHLLKEKGPKIDMGHSGGAFCHIPDKVPFFSDLHTMTDKEGAWFVWDYHFAGWAAPNLKLSGDGRRFVNFYVKRGDGLRRDFRIPYSDEMPAVELDMLYRELEQAKDDGPGDPGVRVVFEMNENDFRSARADFTAMFAVLGYIMKDESNGHYFGRHDTASGKRVDRMFHREFTRAMYAGDEYNYVEFLGTLGDTLDDQEPYFHSAFGILESQCPDGYAADFRRAGFSDAYSIDCREMFRRVGNRDALEFIEKDYLGRLLADMSMFTYARY